MRELIQWEVNCLKVSLVLLGSTYIQPACPDFHSRGFLGQSPFLLNNCPQSSIMVVVLLSNTSNLLSICSDFGCYTTQVAGIASLSTEKKYSETSLGIQCTKKSQAAKWLESHWESLVGQN